MIIPPDLVTPVLPQDDPYPDQRMAWLSASRAIYQFDTSYADIGFAQQVPLWDRFSPEYLATAALLQGTVYANQGAAALKHCQSAPEGGWRFAIKSSLEALRDRSLQAQWGPVRDPRVASYDERTPRPIQDYEQIFQLIQPPPNRYRWQEDWAFAWQRLAGTAPILIRSIDALPENFPVTEAHMQRATGGADSLQAALAEGRLFLVDFFILDGIAAGVTDYRRKYLYAPMVLLRWDPSATEPPGGPPGRLLPVAIQCGQRPGPDTPIFTPADGTAWAMAKLVVQSADSNYHGVVEHLGRCHVMAGWLALYTFRHLAPNHPLRILLTPHFQFTLAINQPTRALIMPGGRTPRLQSTSFDSTAELARRGLEWFDWNAMAPPTDFQQRGVTRDLLPVYPYRDDILLHWQAIRAFVGDYVHLYYSTDTDVGEDSELQDWFRAMGSGDGAKIRGMGRNDELATREDVAELVAQIIWRVTSFHAVINYTVFPAMAFVPNMPTALYGPAPTGAADDYQPDDLLSLLPPLEIALETLSDVYVVGHLRCNQLGQYGECHFQDRRVRPLVARLQSQLVQIEHDIQAANRQRPASFEILLPSRVPQSVHI